jgi:hypothetical protein
VPMISARRASIGVAAAGASLESVLFMSGIDREALTRHGAEEHRGRPNEDGCDGNTAGGEVEHFNNV